MKKQKEDDKGAEMQTAGSVSVIIAVYNVKAYLESCLESICGQTYSDLEIILVDDGSTDSSAAICDRWREKDARIKVVHQKNAGVSAARNKGLDTASGAYVTFVDSDDWLEPDFVGELLRYHQEGNLTVTGYWIDYVKKKGNKSIAKIYGKDTICHISYEMTADLFRVGLFGSIWNKLYERECILEHNIRFPEDMNLGEDIVFNLHYLQALQGQICVVNKPLYHYMRRGRESLVCRYNEKYVEAQKKIYMEFFHFLDGVENNHDGKKMLNYLYFNDLVAAIDNLYLNRDGLEPSFYHSSVRKRRRDPEFKKLLDQMGGKTKWMYSVRYFLVSHGLFVVDYYLRKIVKWILRLE